jgi:hypothetical protein
MNVRARRIALNTREQAAVKMHQLGIKEPFFQPYGDSYLWI